MCPYRSPPPSESELARAEERGEIEVRGANVKWKWRDISLFGIWDNIDLSGFISQLRANEMRVVSGEIVKKTPEEISAGDIINYNVRMPRL